MKEEINQNKAGEECVAPPYVKPLTANNKIVIVLFGVIIPVLAFMINYYSSSQMRMFNLFYSTGAMLLLPRTAYLYITVGSGITAILLWTFYFHKKKCYGGFFAGIFIFNALFCLAFGIAGVIRFLIIPVWFPPFCAALVLLFCSVRSLKMARTVMSKKRVIASAFAGVVLVIVLSLAIIRQPWGFVRHLPDARGADFSYMDLSDLFVEGGSGVSFEGADFNHANLRNSSFVHCRIIMQNVNMEGADLTGVCLSGVDFEDSNFSGANLNDAEVYQVDFIGVDFQDARLGFEAQGRIFMDNANLCGADLTQLKNIGGVYSWRGAKYDSSTLWPENFDPNYHGMILIQSKQNNLRDSLLWKDLTSESRERIHRARVYVEVIP